MGAGVQRTGVGKQQAVGEEMHAETWTGRAGEGSAPRRSQRSAEVGAGCAGQHLSEWPMLKATHSDWGREGDVFYKHCSI